MASTTEAAAPEAPKGNQFGTFGGVFTPSILTILGVIMFMRTGFVIGQAGVRNAVIILIGAKLITFLTGLSISGISTNTKVEGGGAYFLISRSLGPGYGGAIGLALFLAQALSVPFYILGFVEAIVTTFPALSDYFMLFGIATTILIFVVNLVGADLAVRAQYGILAVLALSIVAFLGGSALEFDPEILQANMAPNTGSDAVGFWVIFAVFFPAVTGIMAGVNMSGDLKNPAKSIPAGTLAAIGVGFLVYFGQIVLTGGAIPRETLISAPYQSLSSIALFNMGFLIVLGVLAATLSSALGSFLGAPRILQALARDDIFPMLSPFAKGTGENDEPTRGYFLTFAMTIGLLVVVGNNSGGGALNVVAAVLTMFFLYTYGMTNIAAFVEHIGRNPSFRPRFKYFHWFTALLGAIGCFGAALLINVAAAIVAFAMIGAVFAYTEHRVMETSFGDARRGFYYARVRENMFKLAAQPPHAKNWRPTTLVLSGNPKSRLTLCTYADWIESKRGIVTLARIIVGPYEEKIPERAGAIASLNTFIQENNLNAFPEVLVTPDFMTGLASLIQSHSVGPIKPNVVMMGWSADAERTESFGRLLRMAAELNMSQVIVVDKGLPEVPKRIDIWWRGKENGSLMLILAHLLTHTWQWRKAELRVLRIAGEDASSEQARRELHELVDAARIDATVAVVGGKNAAEVIRHESADASVVLLGFRPPPVGDDQNYHDNYAKLVEGLPTTLLVSSTGEANLFA